MFNVIESLYYGNFEAMEMTNEYTPKLKKQLNELTSIEEKLYSKLTDEDKELFKSYREAYCKFTSTSCADSFINGFRFGGKIAVDMLAE